MYHSITIGINDTWKNTWDDWHLIPASRPLVNPPPAKTSFVEIPGMDGTLDMTAAITGKAMFGDRTGSWSFYVENGFKTWSNMYSEIMNYLHGKRMRAILEDDPGYYYEGRFSVNEWRSDAARSLIVISYEVGPYKMYEGAYNGKWLWDPLKFGTFRSKVDRGDRIQVYKNIVLAANTPTTIDISGDIMDVIPIISCGSNGVKMTHEGKTYNLVQGNNFFDDIVITTGENSFTFTSNRRTTISFIITGGRL